MKKAAVIGGNSGIGLAITIQLLKNGYDHVYIAGKDQPNYNEIPAEAQMLLQTKSSFDRINLVNQEYGFLESYDDIDTLIITVGFGRVNWFENLAEAEIANLIKCDFASQVQIIKHFYDKLCDNKDFYCAVMGSIAGHVASPLFSVYGAAKAGLCSFIENINIELAHKGCTNRILDVSPGSLKGTNFNGTGNDLSLTIGVAQDILEHMYARDIVYIPQYEEVYKDVIQRYHADTQKFGLESCAYKLNSGRLSDKPQVTIGYLSGTFDLFHIGHLNLLRRAKEQCDYLIVGVHKSGAWKGKETFIPFEERRQIVESVKYVDKAIESFPEDCDAYDVYHYNKLFVGDDYKGTERFRRYEEYFKDKGVEIVYFSYTKGTSSTQLRNAIRK